MEIKKRINYRLLFLTLGILLMAGHVFAQPPQRGGRQQGPPPLPDSTQIVQMVDELATAISLSDELKSEVSDLYFTHFDKVGELQEKYKGHREGHREAMDDLKAEFDDQVKDLLTEDQVELFEEYQENRKRQQRGSRPGRR